MGVRFFWFGRRAGVVGLIVLFVLVNRVGGVLALWDLLVRVIALVICLVTLVLALDLVAGACGSRLLCWLGLVTGFV